LDKETSKIMSCNVVSGIDNDKTGEIAQHNIHEVGFTTVIRNFAGLAKIDMKDVERAAEGPREDKLTVASNRTIGSQRTSDKFGGRGSSIDGSEKMDINEMVDEMGAKLERAAGRASCSISGRRGSTGNRVEKDGRG
jgi:hypothetical protein